MRIHKSISVRKISVMGIFLGVIFVLNIVESLIAPAIALNIRPGLSNIVVMYAFFYMGKKEAFTLNGLKAVFVLITRGFMAGFLSLTGGILSVCVIMLLNYAFKKKISMLILSVSGAMAHNLGQITAAFILTGNVYLFYYLPVMLFFSVGTGVITGVLLRVLLPYFDGLVREERET